MTSTGKSSALNSGVPAAENTLSTTQHPDGVATAKNATHSEVRLSAHDPGSYIVMTVLSHMPGSDR